MCQSITIDMSARAFPRSLALSVLGTLAAVLGGCGKAEPEAPPPVPTLVTPEELAAALPEVIGQWRLGAVDARVLERNETSVRVVGQYAHPDFERVFFELLDCLESPSLKALFEVTYDTKVDGYFRIKPQGHRGVKIVSKTPLSTGVKVMVAERFLFLTSGEGVEVEAMDALVAGFDFNRIAGLQ